eukprot:959545-Prorocentrum_minimum.AAC.1
MAGGAAQASGARSHPETLAAASPGCRAPCRKRITLANEQPLRQLPPVASAQDPQLGGRLQEQLVAAVREPPPCGSPAWGGGIGRD